jgi:hypothetical protein
MEILNLGTWRRVTEKMIGRGWAQGVLYLLLIAIFFRTGILRAQEAVSLSDSVAAQGGVVRVDVRAEPRPDTVTGVFLNSRVPFLDAPGGGFYALLGVDMEVRPGVYRLDLRLRRSDGRVESLSRRIRVRDARFPVQRLTLPPAKVFPDTAAQARIKREDELRDERWSHWAPRAFWGREFLQPVAGEMVRFGNRRILNGVSRSPHSGVDISAPEGTPVLCPSGGRVILVGDFFFTGNSVYIDHGLGLISMFFHLARVEVAEGDTLREGQELGTVGSTGRVTGPHLHWGVRYRGSRIDPAALLRLELE